MKQRSEWVEDRTRRENESATRTKEKQERVEERTRRERNLPVMEMTTPAIIEDSTTESMNPRMSTPLLVGECSLTAGEREGKKTRSVAVRERVSLC